MLDAAARLEERLAAEREAAGIPRDAEVRQGLYVDPADPVDLEATAKVQEAMRRATPMLPLEHMPLELHTVTQYLQLHLSMRPADMAGADAVRQEHLAELHLHSASHSVVGATLRQLADDVDPYPLEQIELDERELVPAGTLEAVRDVLAAWRACQRVTDQASLHAALQQLQDVLE